MGANWGYAYMDKRVTLVISMSAYAKEDQAPVAADPTALRATRDDLADSVEAIHNGAKVLHAGELAVPAASKPNGETHDKFEITGPPNDCASIKLSNIAILAKLNTKRSYSELNTCESARRPNFESLLIALGLSALFRPLLLAHCGESSVHHLHWALCAT
jgi:hypothetical protein